MKKFKPKVVILHGTFNSGKTILYNLFKKEGNYKCIDISPHHIFINKNELKQEIGVSETRKLYKAIRNKHIFASKFFLIVIKNLIKKFPNFNFVIKPGNYFWFKNNQIQDDMFDHISIMRNPKVSWLINPNHISIDEYIEGYKIFDFKHFLDKRHMIKVEEISKNKFLKQLLPNTDLTKVQSITKYDINLLKQNDFKLIKKDLKKINYQLKELINHFKYNNSNEKKLIHLILKRRWNAIFY